MRNSNIFRLVCDFVDRIPYPRPLVRYYGDDPLDPPDDDDDDDGHGDDRPLSESDHRYIEYWNNVRYDPDDDSDSGSMPELVDGPQEQLEEIDIGDDSTTLSEMVRQLEEAEREFDEWDMNAELDNDHIDEDDDEEEDDPMETDPRFGITDEFGICSYIRRFLTWMDYPPLAAFVSLAVRSRVDLFPDVYAQDILRIMMQKELVERVRISRLHKLVHFCVPNIMISPQSKPILTEKEANTAKFEKNRQGRKNHRERRRMVAKAAKKIAKEIQAHKKQNVPHVAGDTTFDALTSISSIVSMLKSPDTDDIMMHAERLYILISDLSNAKTFHRFLVAVVSYMGKYKKGSVLCTITTILSHLLQDSDFSINENDECVIEPHALTGQEVLDGWEMLKGNAIFGKISYLLCIGMSFSICQTKEIDWKIGDVEILRLEASNETKKATDVIDAVIHVFNWLSQTGYQCIQEKSLKPILYSDQRMKKYYEDVAYLLAYADTAKAGNLESNEYDKYLRILKEALITTSKMQALAPKSMKEVIQRKYISLIAVQQDLVAKEKNTQYRFAPLGISISGESSIGKSNLGEITMKTALSAMEFSTSKTGIITLNEADRYDSTYTTDVVGVHIDDAANVKPDFVEQAPSRKYLTMFNNVAAQAVKAELNEKGCVFINFKCGVITTNVKDLDARKYSNYPVAVLRRFFHVSASVKEKYRVEGGKSLNVYHPDLAGAADPYKIQDVWNFDVEQVIPGAQGYHVLKLNIDGEELICKNIGLRDYLRVLTYLGRRHKVNQDKEVEKNKALEKMECCAKCNLFGDMCWCDLTSEEKANKKTEQRQYEVGGCVVSPEEGCTEIYDCPACNAYHENVPHMVETVVRWAFYDAIRLFFGRLVSSIIPTRSIFNFFIWNMLPTSQIMELVEEQMNHRIPFVVKWTPRVIFRSDLYQRWVRKRFVRNFCVDLHRFQQFIRMMFLPLLPFVYFFYGLLGVFLYTVVCYFIVLFCEEQMHTQFVTYMDMLENQRNSLDDYAKHLRDSWKVPGAISAALISAASAMMLWNHFRHQRKEKPTYTASDLVAAYEAGFADRGTEEDMTTRNALEVKETNEPHGLVASSISAIDKLADWRGSLMPMLGLKMKNTTTPIGATPTQAVASILSNLAWGSFTLDNGKTYSCNVFFPRKSVMLFPRHILCENNDLHNGVTRLAKCVVTRSDRPGGKFSVAINPNCCYDFEHLDLLACFVPNCPDIATKTQWLPDVLPEGPCMAKMVTCDSAGEKSVLEISPNFGKVEHTSIVVHGASYISRLARKGSCMSPIINESKRPCIVGFHIGGNEVEHRGICQTVIKSDLEACFTWLNENAGILSAEASVIPKMQMGKPVLKNDKVNPKAKYLQSLTNEAFVELYGSTNLRSEQKSEVVPSILSTDVHDVCGVPQQWGPPKLKPNWEAFNTNVSQFSNPTEMFDPELLKRAQMDWEKPLHVAMNIYCEEEDFRPLTLKESVMGIPGKKFIDPLPMNTGIGFPLFGKKNKTGPDGELLHFDEVWDGEQLIDRIPKEHIMEEYNRMLEAYKVGKRAYPVTSATLKDEPTKIGKEKVRVFQAAPVAFSLLLRKYYLPIARFLHMHPELAETAVGVNSFGRGWKRLTKFMRKYSSHNLERLLGWDYRKYDVTMNSQLVRAAWESFIHLAKTGGYSEEDLQIMGAMIVDIAHPLMDLNGTLLMAFNMNTSGNNMTVDVNGTVGSFLVRMGFFSIYPHTDDFRTWVALLTYGDDAGGSIREEKSDFNFITFKKFLAKHGMDLTLPSKTDEERAFLLPGETDFIKRMSTYIEEIGTEIGRLDEDSIWKSLHANVKSHSATPREVAASCIETALHEWFAFGRDHYEKRRSQMKEIAGRHQLVIPALDYTFDDRVAFWKEKYPIEDDIPISVSA
jgi:hypothetical protein